MSPLVSLCTFTILPFAAEAHILLSHQFGIKPFFHQQLLRLALLLHHPVIEDDYVIGLLHGTQLVGYQQHGASVGAPQQSLVDL